jgi:hypothetical protein
MSRLDHSSDIEVRVRIPADTDRPDRLLAGLTARQLVLLAVPAVALWVAWAALRRHVPLVVFFAAAVPVAIAAGGLALGRRDGLGFDRLVVLALRHLVSPRRLVPAPDGVSTAPSVLGVASGPLPASLHLPVDRVRDDGTLDLGHDGTALVCRAVGTSFALRTAAERAGMVAALARYLNGSGGPLEIVVRAEPVDLRPAVAQLRDAAGGLPHPALEAAALDHAAFLTELAATRDLLRREVLVVFRDPAPTAPTPPGREPEGVTAEDPTRDGASERLRRRATDAQGGLAAAGVQLRVLDRSEVAAVLAAALDPLATRRPPSSALGDEPVRGVLPGLSGVAVLLANDIDDTTEPEGGN